MYVLIYIYHQVQDHLPPQTKEALHYRLMFNKEFHPKAAPVIPYLWLPKWSGDQIDPSARKLDIYNQEDLF